MEVVSVLLKGSNYSAKSTSWRSDRDHWASLLIVTFYSQHSSSCQLFGMETCLCFHLQWCVCVCVCVQSLKSFKATFPQMTALNLEVVCDWFRVGAEAFASQKPRRQQRKPLETVNVRLIFINEHFIKHFLLWSWAVQSDMNLFDLQLKDKEETAPMDRRVERLLIYNKPQHSFISLH